MAKFTFDAPVPTLPPELLEKVVAAGKTLLRRRASAEAAAASVGGSLLHGTVDPMFVQHSRIDPTPAGALLSLSELLVAVVEARPFPDGPEGTFELLDAAGTRLGVTTKETAQRLWPTKLYDYGSPDHVRLSGQLDEALRSGDPDAIAAATDQLKLVRPPPRS